MSRASEWAETKPTPFVMDGIEADVEPSGYIYIHGTHHGTNDPMGQTVQIAHDETAVALGKWLIETCGVEIVACREPPK